MKSNYVHDKKGFGMQHVDPLTIVQAWQEAANAQNVERLLELSDPNIEVVGPLVASRLDCPCWVVS